MTPEEVANGLLDSGYQEVDSFGSLSVGTRVRLSGESWPEACEKGTGNVERMFHKPNSQWERKYGRPDVELIVRMDKRDPAYVADYHVQRVGA